MPAAPGAGGKRVVAPPPLEATPTSTPACVLQREVLGAAPSERRHRAASFSHFGLQREWDLYASSAQPWWPPFFLRRRTAVQEVVAALDVVIALAHSGVCAAYDQDSGEPLCYLNVEADEVVRTLFLHHAGPATQLITVSVFSGDAFQRLHVRATPVSALRARRPHAWRPLFETEELRYPGFVEFCDVNGIAVTCSAQSSCFKFFELRAPGQPLWSLPTQGVSDLKIAQGTALLVLRPEAGAPTHELHLKVLDLRDGACLKELRIFLKPSSSGSAAAAAPSGAGSGGNGRCACCGAAVGDGLVGVEVVELFGQHLLVKQAGGPLLILDIAKGGSRAVPAAEFSAPSAFIHLSFNSTFLAFWQTGDAQLWSLEGEWLASLPGAALPTAAAINTIFVGNQQNLMWVYSPPGSTAGAAAAGGASAAARPFVGRSEEEGEEEQQQQQQQQGCVQVFDLRSGRQVATVTARQRPPGGGRGKQQARAAAASVAAMRHLSALFYDEQSHRLYTGTADGRVQSWSL